MIYQTAAVFLALILAGSSAHFALRGDQTVALRVSAAVGALATFLLAGALMRLPVTTASPPVALVAGISLLAISVVIGAVQLINDLRGRQRGRPS